MSAKSQIAAVVRQEVESLHKFLQGWYMGILAKDSFETDFLAQISPGFVNIMPGGSVLGLEDLADAVKKGYGSNPDFRIAVRNVVVRHELPGHALATYEEYQKGAKNSAASNNGRVSTALFATGDKLKWLHIHETWMPPEKTPAKAFDF